MGPDSLALTSLFCKPGTALSLVLEANLPAGTTKLLKKLLQMAAKVYAQHVRRNETF